MPLAFLGFALWRAWVSLSYANPAALLPVNVAGGKLPYDIVLAACAVAIAAPSPAGGKAMGLPDRGPGVALLPALHPD